MTSFNNSYSYSSTSNAIPIISSGDPRNTDDGGERDDGPEESSSSPWMSLFSSSFPRANNSFGNLRSLMGIQVKTQDAGDNETTTTTLTTMDKKWLCVSPMTHHIIRESAAPSISPVHIRKRRSRSFSDYIDSREGERHRPSLRAAPGWNLPPFHEVQPPAPPITSSLRSSDRLAASSFLPPIRRPTIASSMPSAFNDAVAAVSGARVETAAVTAAVSPNGPLSPTLQQESDDNATNSVLSHDHPDDQHWDDFDDRKDNHSSDHKDDQTMSVFISVLYGMINATIVIPVVMSFGNIIYQDAQFQPYMPILIKLTMVSGVVHQLCFSTLSSLPFAVGSVQDAGLIFLSSMASDMVHYCQTMEGIDQDDDSVILATVTVGLGLSAFVLGIGLIIIGKLQLAGYVQMLPTCVVAGYLAYIGFFCGKSGLRLMATAKIAASAAGGGNSSTDDLTTAFKTNQDTSSSTSSTTDLTWRLLVQHWWLVLPGVLGGTFIYLSVRTFRHVAVLPTCIAILLLCFYCGLAITGSSIDQATHRGWIRDTEPAPVWYHTWDYLQLDKVVWSAMPQSLLTEVSMLFVVALSSSLDVAAIELEMGKPLNYNKELTMVGISNVISGLTGGYTGSYIFSQSIFSLRSGIQSRVAGFCLAGCQILVIVTPFPILSYVPNFFYGSLLGMICLDLMIEWLWDFRAKVATAEYVIGLSTFGLIQCLGVEYGILAGVVIYAVCRQLQIPVGELKIVTNENEQAQASAAAAWETEHDDKAVQGEDSPLMISIGDVDVSCKCY